ncbi:hypothetical protein FQN50_002118 [Emmonsiellopsis sp. PD_5]|nr:hypothetical protein FQN50_002118 [Emmonsiellopsis sp. PD_5]
MSTPSSASSVSSPAPLAPAYSRQPSLSAKPLAAAATPMPVKPTSITTREWVIPPRPKPGRKPATDTPPTKRKAQNRAAQRAFRERRAARVGELEEQIKQIEEENDREEAALKERIDTLSSQLDQSKIEISWWKKRCQNLENQVTAEKNAKEALMKSGPPAERISVVPDTGIACENCSSTRCQCIDDAFNFANITAAQQQDDPSSKRPHSPHPPDASKRHKPEFRIKAEPEELETDFTSIFSATRVRKRENENNEAVSPSAMFDPCGFCQDGTPCMCAEMAAEEQNNTTNNTFKSPERNRLAPIQNYSQFTPPPSEGDVFTENHPSLTNKKPNPCINGPGTCAQCQADPKSTLFCKSLAASRASSAAAGSGCCGGRGSGDGCCQSRSTTQDGDRTQGPRNNNSSPTPTVTLSCADTYTALSRHPKFSRATDDLGTWLPRLHTLPNPRDLPTSGPYGGRAALEVEAASVMGVLKYFDRRFAD